MSAVAKAAGVSRTTVYAGLAEIEAASKRTSKRSRSAPTPLAAFKRVRAPGGGRKRLTDLDETLLGDLDALVEPTSRGDPMSPLRWTCKSTTRLADELSRQGHQVSQRTVCDLLAQGATDQAALVAAGTALKVQPIVAAELAVPTTFTSRANEAGEPAPAANERLALSSRGVAIEEFRHRQSPLVLHLVLRHGQPPGVVDTTSQASGSYGELVPGVAEVSC